MMPKVYICIEQTWDESHIEHVYFDESVAVSWAMGRKPVTNLDTVIEVWENDHIIATWDDRSQSLIPHGG